MNIFSVISLLGGLAFFLYGMKVMSDGLEKSSNGKLNKYMEKVTHNKLIAMLFGAGITVAVQSSSAVTVMLVGLVNSGILSFGQTIGILMGSNIGTTLTAWILSLAGIESDIIWVNLLKPVNFAPIFALAGIIMLMAGKKPKTQSTGSVFIGFSILMFGMNLMSESMEPLGEMPEFTSILTAFRNPLLSVLFGAVFTGIIQSSAASVAILQALSMTGSITYGMAIPIIAGQNIGTCVTAVISGIGVSRNAKKVAVVHLSFNISGTLICLIPFYILNSVFDWEFADSQVSPFMIAVIHSLFNLITTAVLLPFTKQLEHLADKILPNNKSEHTAAELLDDRLLAVPTIAVKKSFDVMIEMCGMAKLSFQKAIGLITEFDEKEAETVLNTEKSLDKLEDSIGTYMMKLSKVGVSEEDSKTVAKILHTIDDFERIGDHSLSIAETAKVLFEKKLSFSKEANTELLKIGEAVSEIMNITAKAFEEEDLTSAKSVEPLEQVIDNLIFNAKRNHISRLRNDACTAELVFLLNDLFIGCERISDHCSNIAVAIIEAHHGSFDTHRYLDDIKNRNNEDFKLQYEAYSQKFFF